MPEPKDTPKPQKDITERLTSIADYLDRTSSISLEDLMVWRGGGAKAKLLREAAIEIQTLRKDIESLENQLEDAFRRPPDF